MIKPESKRAVSLLVVLPIILILFVLGFMFIESVLLYTSQNQIHLSALQLKYAAIAARELAALEIEECGFLASHTPKNQTEIHVQLSADIPNQGLLFFGGNSSIPWFEYTKKSITTLSIPNGTPLKQPYGTTLYLGRDLDGDGNIGGITNKSIFQSNCNVEVSSTHPQSSFMVFQVSCTMGQWREEQTFAVHYD